MRKVSSPSARSGQAETTRAPPPAKRRPASSVTAATSWSTAIVPPRSTVNPTRRPSREPVTGGANACPGSPSASGTLGSGPASTESSSARSSTVRAIGPPTDVVSHRLPVGQVGTRPSDGRRPTTPQNDAGLRSEPPMSEPSASGTMPAARAAAAPPLLPPALRDGSCGLRVVPKTVLKVCEPGRELRDVGLADQHDAGPADPLDDQVVVGGHVVGVQRGSVRRRATRPLRGCPSPRTADRAAGRSSRRRRGARRRARAPSRARSSSSDDDRVELRIALGDAGQVEVHQLARGDVLAGHRRRHRQRRGVDASGRAMGCQPFLSVVGRNFG